MAKVQNTFLKSKMNKDLDARILPNGEYREATNIQISRSENSEVGALENVLGNISILNFQTLTGIAGLKCIGQLPNELNNTLYLFLTNNSESGYKPTKNNFIVSINTLTSEESILVEGAFLNFSTLNPIYGVNILEGLLFWSDNRNQPRKIDVTFADRFYYTTEDQISVAKYNPYQCMELYEFSTLAASSAVPYETTMKDVTSKAFPNGGVGTVKGTGATGSNTIDIPAGGFKGDIVIPSSPYSSGATIGYIASASANIVMIATGATNATVVSSTYVVPTTPVGNPDPPYFTVVITGGNFPTIPVNVDYDIVFNPNPYYNPQFPGDSDYLENKFARFSYRFKFENNEYSIFAPFTQTTFIPKQDGYFMYLNETGLPKVDDQTNTYRSTVASFVENKVDDIKLRIPLPFKNYELANKLKITEIDVLYKESDGLSVKVVDTISTKQILESSATCIVNGAITSSNTVVVDNIVGGIKAGDTVSGAGLNSAALTTFPATVISFNSTTKTIVLSEAVTLQNDVVLTINNPEYFVYNYQSTKPFKTLPEFQTTRVYDKTPVRALAQEISGNRVIYGNYIDKHTPPASIDYNVACTEKEEFSVNEINATASQTYVNTNTVVITLAKGRDANLVATGMIFTSDSLGAIIPLNTFISNFTISGVVVTLTLTNNVTVSTGDIIILQPGGNVENSTSRIEYPSHSVKTNRNYQVGFVLSDRYGRQSSVILSNNTEELTINNITYAGSTLYSPYIGEEIDPDEWAGNSLKLLVNNPITGASTGLYNGDTASPKYNPIGWYSYKVVVKQTEQDYYNVYLPGILAAYPNDANLELGNTSHAVLINDNINKVPRDLNEVGPEQRQFRSSVQLFGRVENTIEVITIPNVGDSNTQYYPGRSSDTVSTISTVNDLFDYNPADPKQPNYFPQFYDLNSNPLIARISTESKIGQISTTNYSPSSAVVEADVDNNFIISITSTTGTPGPDDLVSGQNIPDEVYINTITPPAGADAAGITNGDAGAGSLTEYQVSLAVLSGTITPGSIITGDDAIPEGTIVLTYAAGILTVGPTNGSNTITGLSSGARLTFTVVPGKINLKGADGAAFRISVKAETVLSFSETLAPFPGDVVIPGIQYLAVYETEPVESLLDIFWETSTAGLISELNDAILNSSDAGAGFSGFNLNPFTEGLANGAAILQTPFQLTTNFGDIITGGALVLNSVTELLNGIPGIDVSNYFALDESTTDFWTIKTTQAYYDNVFYFFDDNAEKRQFRFTFTSTVNSQENIIVEDAFLENEDPIITPTSLATIYSNITVTGPLLLGVGIQGVNGANNILLRRSDLNWSITHVRQGLNTSASDVTSNNLFLLSTNNNASTSTLDAQISNNVGESMPPDIFYLRLDLVDGNGDAFIEFIIDFRLLIPSGNIFNALTQGVCQGETQGDEFLATLIVIDANVPGAIASTYGRYYFTRGMFENYGNNTSLVAYSGGNLITLPLNAPDAAGNQVVTSGSGFNCPVWFYVAAPGSFSDLEDLVGNYECDCEFGATINITTNGCSNPSCGGTIPQNPDVTGYAFQII